jgi:hypothetical protein
MIGDIFLVGFNIDAEKYGDQHRSHGILCGRPIFLSHIHVS